MTSYVNICDWPEPLLLGYTLSVAEVVTVLPLVESLEKGPI